MAVTSRELHHVAPRRLTGVTYPAVRRKVNFGILRQLIRPALVMLVVYGALLIASGQAQVWLDDLRYGRPRTMEISGMVGHHETDGQPTQFVAMNLNRQVVVMEIPGGDPTRTQILQGPHLFGATEDLTPVRLLLTDLNGDGKQDLVISVKNEDIVYLNSGDSFRLMTPAERQQVGAIH